MACILALCAKKNTKSIEFNRYYYLEPSILPSSHHIRRESAGEREDGHLRVCRKLGGSEALVTLRGPMEDVCGGTKPMRIACGAW